MEDTTFNAVFFSRNKREKDSKRFLELLARTPFANSFDQVIVEKADPEFLKMLKVDRVPTLYYQGQKYVDVQCTQLIMALLRELQEAQAPPAQADPYGGSQMFSPYGLQAGQQPVQQPAMGQFAGQQQQLQQMPMMPMETFTDPNFANPYQQMPMNPAAGMPQMPPMGMPQMPGMGMQVGGGMGQQRNPFEGVSTKTSDNSVEMNLGQLQQMRQMEIPGSDQPSVRNQGGGGYNAGNMPGMGMQGLQVMPGMGMQGMPGMQGQYNPMMMQQNPQMGMGMQGMGGMPQMMGYQSR